MQSYTDQIWCKDKTMTLSNNDKSIKSGDDGRGDFYQLSQTTDGAETTLLPIDRPVLDGEQVIFRFKAKDFDEARAMANQFLGFV